MVRNDRRKRISSHQLGLNNSHGNGTLLPAEANLEIVILRNMLPEVIQQIVALVLVKLVDAPGEAAG